VRWRATLAGVLLTAGCSTAVGGQGAVAATCPPVFFGVAGSGQGPQNPPPGRIPDGVSAADARAYGPTVALLKSRLVAVAGRRLARATAVDYPALPVDQYIGPVGLKPDLDRSETQGVRTLLRGIRSSYRSGCGSRPVLLAGYSQGAEVVARAVTGLTTAQQQHVAVALFGNPSYRPGVRGDYPGGTRAAGIRPTFLDGKAYVLPAAVRARTLDVCAPGDPVCGVDPSVRTFFARVNWVLDHAHVHAEAYAFARTDYAAIAARFLWRHRR
jgi:Cutinase